MAPRMDHPADPSSPQPHWQPAPARPSTPSPVEALDAVAGFLDRFVVWPTGHARVATALWVAHTYLIEEFDSTPRLAFLSPEPGSGKTRALEVIGSLVRHPMHAINATPAALFRSVADLDRRPTILFDEIDTIFGPKAKDNEEVRGFLNAGHRRSGVAYRCAGLGTNQRVAAFPAFAAVAVAGLDDLPGTIASRAIVVRMRRRAGGEQIEPYRLRHHEPEGLNLGERLADALDGLTLPDEPLLPDGVVDRPADVWEPLLAIAQAVHPTWAEQAARACVHLIAENRVGVPSLNITLLDDLRAVFTSADSPRAIPTATLIEALRGREESPWRDLRGKPLDPAGLARRLRGFDISSVNLRFGAQVVKGYRLADFHDAWTRYLPPAPGNAATTPHDPRLQLQEANS